MDISSVNTGVTQIKLEGVRQSDTTLNLGRSGSGANISDWPDTITLTNGAILRLTNNPRSESRFEIAWYEV